MSCYLMSIWGVVLTLIEIVVGIFLLITAKYLIGSICRFPLVRALIGIVSGCIVGFSTNSWIWGLLAGAFCWGISIYLAASTEKDD